MPPGLVQAGGGAEWLIRNLDLVSSQGKWLSQLSWHWDRFSASQSKFAKLVMCQMVEFVFWQQSTLFLLVVNISSKAAFAAIGVIEKHWNKIRQLVNRNRTIIVCNVT